MKNKPSSLTVAIRRATQMLVTRHFDAVDSALLNNHHWYSQATGQRQVARFILNEIARSHPAAVRREIKWWIKFTAAHKIRRIEPLQLKLEGGL